MPEAIPEAILGPSLAFIAIAKYRLSSAKS